MKNKKWALVISLAAWLVLAGAREAQAVIFWDWFFLDQEFMLLPTDTFTIGPQSTAVLPARIFNSFLSTEQLTQANFFAASYSTNPSSLGGTADIYDLAFGPPGGDFFSQFTGLDLAPGDGFNFIFGTMSPIGGTAPIGTFSGNAGVVLKDALPGLQSHPLNIRVVPEPSALLLLGSGLLGLAGWRRKFHAP